MATHGPDTTKTCGFTCNLHCASKSLQKFRSVLLLKHSLPRRFGLQRPNLHTKTASRQYLERRDCLAQGRDSRVMRWLEDAEQALLCYAKNACFLFYRHQANISSRVGRSDVANTSFHVVNFAILSLRLLLFAFVAVVLLSRSGVNSVGISNSCWLSQ